MDSSKAVLLPMLLPVEVLVLVEVAVGSKLMPNPKPMPLLTAMAEVFPFLIGSPRKLKSVGLFCYEWYMRDWSCGKGTCNFRGNPTWDKTLKETTFFVSHQSAKPGHPKTREFAKGWFPT